MERPIGQRFSWDGKVLMVHEGIGCADCFFVNPNCSKSTEVRNLAGTCYGWVRSDGKSVYFKEIKGEKMNKMTSEDYLKAHRNSGIEVGDKVRVLRKAEDHEQGWGNTWTGRMNRCIEHKFTVLYDDKEDGFILTTESVCGSDFHFPWFVLEITEKKNQCPINVDDLNFGCVNIEDVKDVLDIYLKDGDYYKAKRVALDTLGGYNWVACAMITLVSEMNKAKITNGEFNTIKEMLFRSLNYLRG